MDTPYDIPSYTVCKLSLNIYFPRLETYTPYQTSTNTLYRRILEDSIEKFNTMYPWTAKTLIETYKYNHIL